jgi:phosphoglycolate phosphatase-like HAD superfamily hydrolase
LASRFRLYVSSTTPEKALKEIVRARRWKEYFCEVFGYPGEKAETLRSILKKERINPKELLVVGDGESDKNAAHTVGCDFRHVASEEALTDILGDLLLET